METGEGSRGKVGWGPRGRGLRRTPQWSCSGRSGSPARGRGGRGRQRATTHNERGACMRNSACQTQHAHCAAVHVLPELPVAGHRGGGTLLTPAHRHTHAPAPAGSCRAGWTRGPTRGTPLGRCLQGHTNSIHQSRCRACVPWAVRGRRDRATPTRPKRRKCNENVNVLSLGLSNATEEQQVYSAIWDMPMLQGVCPSTGCSSLHPRRHAMYEVLCVCMKCKHHVPM